jgi:ketosteroid isomerase-like protein
LFRAAREGYSFVVGTEETARETLEQKADVVREIFACLSRRYSAGAAEYWAENATFDFTRSRAPHRGMKYGRAGIKANWEHFLGTWDQWISDPHGFIDLGDDRVLFSIRARMVGRDGIELDVKAAHIWTIRGGLVTEGTFFQSREDALAPAGLRDEPA